MARITLAAVAAAHGIKGEVRLKLFSESAESLAQHKKLFVGGAERKLVSVRAAGKGAVSQLMEAAPVVLDYRWSIEDGHSGE